MKFRLICIALGATLLTPAVKANETGLASIHDWRREGGRTCMSDHFHYGSGKGPTRKKAEAAAISSWASFTDLEYGSSWARYSLAAGKAMSCLQSSESWNCDVRARPCKR